MFTQTMYKGRRAVAVEGRRLTALFLPDDGAKMASLVSLEDGYEHLCQDPGAGYRVLTADGDYVAAECSAFDDMFPTIDPCTPAQGRWQGVRYPDHGEVCRLPHEARSAGGVLTLRARSRLYEVDYEKRVSLDPQGDIRIDYSVTNRGKDDLPCLWAGHMMLQGRDDAYVVAPFGPDSPLEYTFGADRGPLPDRSRLSGFSPDGNSYKYYYLDPVPRGECGYVYPSRGRRLMLYYDGAAVPYLGVWFNNGGFKGLYNIAFEPCTAPFDDPLSARRRGYDACLAAGECLRFTLTLSLETIE